MALNTERLLSARLRYSFIYFFKVKINVHVEFVTGGVELLKAVLHGYAGG